MSLFELEGLRLHVHAYYLEVEGLTCVVVVLEFRCILSTNQKLLNAVWSYNAMMRSNETVHYSAKLFLS